MLAMGLLVATGCTLAGVWQWERHVARGAANDALGNAEREAVPIAEVLRDSLDPADAWTPVTVVGRYLADGTVLLRNRPVEGRPALGLLEPFAITDGDLAGSTLVVHRGWVDPDIEAVPTPPGSAVELVVRLRPGEPPAGREPPNGQAQRIAPEQVLAASGAEATGVLPAYGVLVTENASAPQDVHPVPLPRATFGPHLSYAFQWWVFAVGALVGALVLVRREAAQDEQQPAGRPSGPPPRRPGRRSAEEEEDALVDAASPPTGPA